ncbi:hypothetical protein CA284_23190 [Enterobacter mori]|nr:hypothetical protein CA284_23190 [Enterobacter mori]
MVFSAFALIVVLHDLLIFTSAEPTCCQKGQQFDVLACQFSFLNQDIRACRRVSAAPQGWRRLHPSGPDG